MNFGIKLLTLQPQKWALDHQDPDNGWAMAQKLIYNYEHVELSLKQFTNKEVMDPNLKFILKNLQTYKSS